MYFCSLHRSDRSSRGSHQGQEGVVLGGFNLVLHLFNLKVKKIKHVSFTEEEDEDQEAVAEMEHAIREELILDEMAEVTDVVKELSDDKLDAYVSEDDLDYEPTEEEVAAAREEEEDFETDSEVDEEEMTEVLKKIMDESDEEEALKEDSYVVKLPIVKFTLPKDVEEELSEDKLKEYLSEDDGDYEPTEEDLEKAEQEDLDIDSDNVSSDESSDVETESDEEEIEEFVIEDVEAEDGVEEYKPKILLEELSDAKLEGYKSEEDVDYQVSIEDVGEAEEDDLDDIDVIIDAEQSSDEEYLDEHDGDVNDLENYLDEGDESDVEKFTLPPDVEEELSEEKLNEYNSEEDEDYEATFDEVVKAELDEEESTDEASSNSSDEEESEEISEDQDCAYVGPVSDFDTEEVVVQVRMDRTVYCLHLSPQDPDVQYLGGHCLPKPLLTSVKQEPRGQDDSAEDDQDETAEDSQDTPDLSGEVRYERGFCLPSMIKVEHEAEKDQECGGFTQVNCGSYVMHFLSTNIAFSR